MKPLKNKQRAVVDAIVDSSAELSANQRAWLIFGLVQQQHKFNVELKPDRDYCTLIDLRNGRVVGSNRCPKCSGWIGRADGYVDNHSNDSTDSDIII